MTDEILGMMRERKENKNDIIKYREWNTKIQKACREAKEKYWAEKCKEVEELDKQNRSKEMYQKVKEMTRKRKNNRGNVCVEDKDGNMLFENHEIEERWNEYIGELYHVERDEKPEIGSDDGQVILKSEVQHAIENLRNDKASGMDEISSEMLKALDEEGIKVITKLCNLIYESEHIPSLLKIPKNKMLPNARNIILLVS
eukprot:Seg944.1 transcript_id=Seg944.1/GoldUCD/mRNA.D3Y31 product="hypothetical protein" protein_id=Seg944.1/GoldUCD/D3Y31